MFFDEMNAIKTKEQLIKFMVDHGDVCTIEIIQNHVFLGWPTGKRLLNDIQPCCVVNDQALEQYIVHERFG